MKTFYLPLSIFILTAAHMVTAFPPYLDMGTFANTLAEESCCVPTAFNTFADAFYSAAQATSQKAGGPATSRYLNRTGKANNHSIVVPNSQRNYCDFLYFAGHGSDGLVSVWNDAGTDNAIWLLQNDEWMFGGWTRWVYLNACDVMNGSDQSSMYQYNWGKAFNGAQAVISFRGYTYFNDLNRQKNTAKKFWLKWTGVTESNGVYTKTGPGIGLYDAHVKSVAEGIYEASSRSLALTPSFVTSSYSRGYHSMTYAQNNGAASPNYWADRFMYTELKQYDPNPY